MVSNGLQKCEYLLKSKGNHDIFLKFTTVNSWFRILALINPRSMVLSMRPNYQLKKYMTHPL
jgi:hypothetical protein